MTMMMQINIQYEHDLMRDKINKNQHGCYLMKMKKSKTTGGVSFPSCECLLMNLLK